MKEETQICPWCQMEIVWDAEIGPEEECPHCFNELDDYRTIEVELDDEQSDQDFYAYEEKIAEYREQQDASQAFECEQCHELMVVTGTLRVEKNAFKPIQFQGLPPFLEGPLELQVQVCPICFQWKTRLSEEHRLRVMENSIR